MASKQEWDFSNQSIEVEPGVRTSPLAKDGLVKYLDPNILTVYQGFKNGVSLKGDGDCLGVRGEDGKYQWESYKQVESRVEKVGSALVARGLKQSQESLVGIYSSNRPEWIIVDLACAMMGMVGVPIYDTIGVNACTYILNQTELSIVFCDTAAKVEQMVAAAKETPHLRTIVSMNSVSQEAREKAKEAEIDLITFQECEEQGSNNMVDAAEQDPSHWFTVCYTSGTTGDPKGVVLTQQSLISNCAAVYKTISTGMEPLNSTDVHISFLPLPHMFERTLSVLMLQLGCAYGFFSGDIKKLVEDIQALQPTFFPAVPRLLNRLYDKVLAGVHQSWLKSKVFEFALSRKKALLKSHLISNDTIWDSLVFHKVQAILGGRVRMIVTGSAPISENVMTFARCAFGCPVMEGYGQTEGSAGVCFGHPLDGAPGRVGPPLPCSLVKLVDVPDMGYFASEGKGEICSKGPCIMIEYYKEPEKTKETIDEDGWLHSGDVGMWLPDGTLKIIDRKKHIFKLQQGEYVAPEKVEQIYMRNKLVAQAYVDGEGTKTCTVAVIVPDVEVFPQWAKGKGHEGDIEELCKNKELNKAVLEDITKTGKELGANGFELAKAIYLCPEMFSVENNLVTPSLKSKRPALRERFKDEMKRLYEQLEASN